MIEGLTFVRQLFKELGEELLSFSSDEVEVRQTKPFCVLLFSCSHSDHTDRVGAVTHTHI